MMKSGRKDSAERGGRRGWKVKLQRCELTDRQLHADNDAWAEVLKEARELREATGAELAEATGLTPLAIRKIEEKRCRPRQDSILRICEALRLRCSLLARVVERRRAGRVLPLAQELRQRWVRRQRAGSVDTLRDLYVGR